MIGFNPIENALLMMTCFCCLVGAICELILNRVDHHIKKIHKIDQDFIYQTTIYRAGIIRKNLRIRYSVGIRFCIHFWYGPRSLRAFSF